MRKLLGAALLLAAACTSSRATAPVTSPEIRIAQTTGVPAAARHIAGPITVRYGVRIANRATEPITLKQISVQSVSSGAYDVRPQSKPFNEVIAPNTSKTVEMWVNGNIADPTILGANGPVSLRLLVHFDSPKGEFDEVVVQPVNALATGQEP